MKGGLLLWGTPHWLNSKDFTDTETWGLKQSMCWLNMLGETASSWALTQEKHTRGTQGAKESQLAHTRFPREESPCLIVHLHTT